MAFISSWDFGSEKRIVFADSDFIIQSNIAKNTVSTLKSYRKIPKISPGACIFQRPKLRGLSTEGNLRFEIDWASLIVGSKFTVFALFYFVFEGNFPSTSPRGAYIWRGDLTEGFLRYRFGGLIHGGLIFGINGITKSINTVKP